MTQGLVLSGGGAKGAFQVGVLKACCEEMLGFDPEVITGTSVGALNGAFLAQYPTGGFKDAVAALEDMWLGLEGNKSIYKRRPLGRLHAAFPEDSWFGASSVYKTDPLRALIAKHFDPEAVRGAKRKLRIGAYSLKHRHRKTWTEKDTSVLSKAVEASAAFPGFFEVVDFDGDRFIDDGVQEIVPVQMAVEAGATDLVIVLASPKLDQGVRSEPMSALDVAWATVDGMSEEVKKGDLEVLEHGLIPYRLFEPRENPLKNSLNFDPELIRKNIQVGYDRAKELLAG